MKWTLLNSGLVMLATAGIATTASAQDYGHRGTTAYRGHTRTVYDVHHGNYTHRHHGTYVENHGWYRDVHHGDYIERHHGNYLMPHRYTSVDRHRAHSPRILLYVPRAHGSRLNHGGSQWGIRRHHGHGQIDGAKATPLLPEAAPG